MSYIKESEDAVLEASQLAYATLKRPVSIKEVITASRIYNIQGPTTPEVSSPLATTGSEGGWQVFDFVDRVQRTLKRLQKQGLIRITETGILPTTEKEIDQTELLLRTGTIRDASKGELRQILMTLEKKAEQQLKAGELDDAERTILQIHELDSRRPSVRVLSALLHTQRELL